MNEYISKQDVINITAETGAWETQNRIRELPPADVQLVKYGRWSECYTDSIHYSGICTTCKSASVRQLMEKPYEFCPRCGAKMIKDGDIHG